MSHFTAFGMSYFLCICNELFNCIWNELFHSMELVISLQNNKKDCDLH